MDNAFLVTCEHGGNRVPVAYRPLFRGQQARLNSHHGFDAGALAMAQALASALGAPLVAATTSRLLVDLNRPTGHPQLYSTVTRNVPQALRAQIFSRYHRPYWVEVDQHIRQSVARGRRTIHISSHSFTAELLGEVREADIGLLYDPGRRGEAELCGRWKAQFVAQAPALRVRRNYPYRGAAAGLTAQLRRSFPADLYVGIELEINQNLVLGARPRWQELRRLVPQSLLAACTA